MVGEDAEEDDADQRHADRTGDLLDGREDPGGGPGIPVLDARQAEADQRRVRPPRARTLDKHDREQLDTVQRHAVAVDDHPDDRPRGGLHEEREHDEATAERAHQPPGEGRGDEVADRRGREGQPGGEWGEMQADLEIERQREEHRRVRRAEEEGDEEPRHEGALAEEA